MCNMIQYTVCNSICSVYIYIWTEASVSKVGGQNPPRRHRIGRVLSSSGGISMLEAVIFPMFSSAQHSHCGVNLETARTASEGQLTERVDLVTIVSAGQAAVNDSLA